MITITLHVFCTYVDVLFSMHILLRSKCHVVVPVLNVVHALSL